MATLSQLQKWRDDLQDARFSGVRTVRDSNGEEVTYKSDSEMRAALASIDNEITALSRKQSGVVRFQTSKGL
ncbi:hypothetical protein [uncultured Sulfitobacter sp.]|uniref:phage head-tail joining protein n=1 Tax=uncultured Sulfitobacter sp. TaxID=191468 RepID=UPI0025944E1C|nr:hypothetical protein [uncultured Sulfitobacter sp.]